MRARHAAFVVFAAGLAIAGPAMAQEEYATYQNNAEGFKIDFPGTPKVMETTVKVENDYVLPERIYTATRGLEKYSVTVIDYNPIEAMGIARRKACPAGAEPCIGSDLSGPGYWKHVIRGALIWATFRFFERPGVKVTSYMWNHQDLVEGHELQMVNPDGSHSFVYISMRENKLFIIEADAPKGYPPPALFQNSLGWVDKDGNAIRYQTIYSNEIYGLGDQPTPGHGGGGGAAGAGAGRGRGAGAGGQGGGGGRRGGGAADPQ